MIIIIPDTQQHCQTRGYKKRKYRVTPFAENKWKEEGMHRMQRKDTRHQNVGQGKHYSNVASAISPYAKRIVFMTTLHK